MEVVLVRTLNRRNVVRVLVRLATNYALVHLVVLTLLAKFTFLNRHQCLSHRYSVELARIPMAGDHNDETADHGRNATTVQEVEVAENNEDQKHVDQPFVVVTAPATLLPVVRPKIQNVRINI